MLDLRWNCFNDSLSVTSAILSARLHEEGSLSAAAKTFDPLEPVSPWTMRCSLLVQEVWSQQTGLEERLPNEILDQIRECQAKLTGSRRFLPGDRGGVTDGKEWLEP